MEKSVVNGRVVSGSTLERTYKNFSLRRALVSLHELSSRLGEAAEGPTSHQTSGGEGRGPGDGGGGRPNNGGTTFETLDPNVVIILVVLLFALICAAFLNSIMRCVMRRSNRARDSPEASQTVQGLDAKALAILPVHSYRGAQFEKLNDGSPVECPICLSDFEENEKVRLLPRCNHVFHIDCIDTWLLSHVSCPVCRDGVTDEPKLESSAIIVVEEQSDSPDNSIPGQSNIRAELRREIGTSSSSYPVHSSSSLPGDDDSGSSSGQGVESTSGRTGRGVRASFSSMFAAENFMILFTAANLGPVSRGHGSLAATASSSASTSSLP